MDSDATTTTRACAHAACHHEQGQTPITFAPGLSVAEVLDRYIWPYEQQYGVLPIGYDRIIEKIVRCRTPDAGRHAWHCSGCGHNCANYNSCGDRHCLHCNKYHKDMWLKRVKSWMLPCDYLHIVFTLPHEFNELIAANRFKLYTLLFESSKKTLLRQSARQLNLVPGVISTIHTWGQAMLPHFHTHNVMTCGGLSLDGSQWIDVDPHDPRLSREALVPLYRKIFLKGLRKLFEKRQLILPNELADAGTIEQFDAWLKPIESKDWVVNVQPPPENSSGPEAALGYLGRYVTGTAISDTRILQDDGTNITIRIKNYREEGAMQELVMPGVEFVKRFVSHILPPGFVRFRYAGILGQRERKANLAKCRELLKDRMPPTEAREEFHEPEVEIEDPEEDDDEGEDEGEDAEPEVAEPKRCPRCRSKNLIYIPCYDPTIDYREYFRTVGWLELVDQAAEAALAKQAEQNHEQAIPP